MTRNGHQSIIGTIIAFDILPMSSSTKQTGIKVAASAVFKDGETKDWPIITRKRLIRLIHKVKANYLVTDNPTEILLHGESIGSFCRRLPAQCNFVHINLTKTGRTVTLKKLLYQYKITSARKKLSPILTAKAIIRLLQMGVGMKLEPFENETIIEVGRPRSPGRGGWSQTRFTRQGEEIVSRATKLIRSVLDQSKLPYDEIIRNTKYGAKLSRFHVFSEKMIIISSLKPLSLYPAKIKIWSPKKQVVTHRSLFNSENEYRAQFYNHLQRLIVGVDPGMTTGVAVVNLKGKVVSLFSTKNLSKGKLVSELSNYGVPVIICTDVFPVPTFVNKLAATYNAEIAYPSSQLSQVEKRQLANKAKIERSIDSHERDALAAVINHFNKLKPHFTKLEKKELNHRELDLAKGLVIRGMSINDSVSAVIMLRNKAAPIEQPMLSQKTQDDEYIGRIYNLLNEIALSEETITNLRAHSGRLEAKINQYEMRIKQLNWEISQARNEITLDILSTELLQEKDIEIKMLRKSLDMQLSEKNVLLEMNSALEQLLWLSLEEGGYPVKVLPIFSQDAIYKLNKEKGLNDGDIVLILDPTGGGPQTAIKLSEVKLRMVFLYEYDLPEQVMRIFYDYNIPVMRSENYDIRRIGYLAIINASNFERAMKDYQTILRKKIAEEREIKINLEIKNYLYEREKTLTKSKKNYDDYEPDEDELIV